MPATATHAIFAMDVYNELPNTIKQLIDDFKATLVK